MIERGPYGDRVALLDEDLLDRPSGGGRSPESTLSVEDLDEEPVPSSMWSPSFFSQRVMVPSTTVSPSCGIHLPSGRPSLGFDSFWLRCCGPTSTKGPRAKEEPTALPVHGPSARCTPGGSGSFRLGSSTNAYEAKYPEVTGNGPPPDGPTELRAIVRPPSRDLRPLALSNYTWRRARSTPSWPPSSTSPSPPLAQPRSEADRAGD